MGYPEDRAPDGWDDDDLYDEPTQAYTGARLANIVAEVESQKPSESGLRLTSKPPSPRQAGEPEGEPPSHDEHETDVAEQQPDPAAPMRAASADPIAELKTSQEVLTDAISRAVGDLPGDLRNAASEATVDLEGDIAVQSESPPASGSGWQSSSRWLPSSRWQWIHSQRVLLPLAAFFALTTLLFGIATIALLVGSDSDEQPSVADTPPAKLSPPATGKQPAKPQAEPVAQAPSASKDEAAKVANAEPSSADDEEPSKDEAGSTASEQDSSEKAQANVVPQRVRRRTTWRARRKTKAKHYVPNDI
jgi:hypothetical protein